MSVFDVISLFGGLAMFLYGMRMMGNGLKESSSGTLKVVMGKVTDNPIKSFLLGVFVTALIQSSTATIVITAGLVGAGILSLHQSLGIIIGANVGTTVTGQIIRLLDVDSSKTAWLQVFKPSTLAPVALIIGIVLIMFLHFKNSDKIGNIAMGFGILFSGLLNMTGAVNAVSQSSFTERLFTGLGDNPFFGYLTGAGVAFVLQSSSASIGILQAFSTTGQLTFKAIYALIVGIYLGDCVTTFIVCSIGAKNETKRVGIVNILFNLSKTAAVLLVVTVIHKLGLIDGLWEKVVNSGDIANTNTVFNLACSVCLFPMLPVYEKFSRKIIVDAEKEKGKYDEIVDAMNPAFFQTPALALNGCYNALLAMLDTSVENIYEALKLTNDFDEKKFDALNAEEDNIDMLMDKVSTYLVQLSPHISADNHVKIYDQYCKVAGEFERLGDHAVNIAEYARMLDKEGHKFSEYAMAELGVIHDVLAEILGHTQKAFRFRDVEAAKHIEPLEQVVDDMIEMMRSNHLARLREGKCDIMTGTTFLDILSNAERISDVCSNIGFATIARVLADANEAHSYAANLHKGEDSWFNAQYEEKREAYMSRLKTINA